MFGSSTYGGPIGEMYLYKSAHNVASLRITIDGPYVEFKDEDGDVQMGSAGSNLRLSANGEEKVRITSDGKVGIGSTEPRQLLNVGFGTARFEGRGDLIFKGDQLINNRNPAIRLGSANNAANVEVDLLFHADNGEHPRIASRRLIGDGDSARIQFTSNGTYARKAITFWTKSAASYSDDPEGRLRITPTGEVNIGGNYTQTTYKMRVTGTVAATHFDSLSDLKLKTNIKTIESGLDKVSKMRGVTFNRDDKLDSGVIAQELEEIAPELVKTADDEMGTKSVAYGNMVGYLIEAVKELKVELDNHKKNCHCKEE